MLEGCVLLYVMKIHNFLPKSPQNQELWVQNQSKTWVNQCERETFCRLSLWMLVTMYVVNVCDSCSSCSVLQRVLASPHLNQIKSFFSCPLGQWSPLGNNWVLGYTTPGLMRAVIDFPAEPTKIVAEPDWTFVGEFVICGLVNRNRCWWVFSGWHGGITNCTLLGCPPIHSVPLCPFSLFSVIIVPICLYHYVLFPLTPFGIFINKCESFWSI